MGQKVAFSEESNVPEGQKFGAAWWAGDFGVFAGAHGEEEGPNHKLSNCNVEGEVGGVGLLDDLFYDGGVDGFLVGSAGVGVGESF